MASQLSCGGADASASVTPTLQPWVLGVYSALRQHLLEERCELLSCLLILYEVAGAKCATLRQAQLVDLLAQARALDAAAGAAGGGSAAAGGAGAQPALDSSTVTEYLVRGHSSALSWHAGLAHHNFNRCTTCYVFV